MARHHRTNTISLALLASLSLLGPRAQAAETPFSFNYGGRITEHNGKPIIGPVNLEVSFYRTANDTVPLGSGIQSYTNIPLTQGVFNLSISMTPSDFHAIFTNFNDAVWIEVKDVSHNKIYPRQRFSAVPFAAVVPTDNKTISFDANGKLTVGPSSAPGAGQFLTKDASGNLVWANPPSAGTALQGQPVNTAAPTNGQVLTYDGSEWKPTTLSNGSVTNVTASAPLSVTNGGTTPALSISQATSVSNGYLSSGDWVTFNAKQNALGFSPVNKAGDTMSGNLNLGTNRITNLATPTLGTDAATKAYADSVGNGMLKRDGSATLTSSWDVGGKDIIGVDNFKANTLLTGGQVAVKIDPWGTTTGKTGELRFTELFVVEGNYVGFKAPDNVAANVMWTLPNADGPSGYILQTNGSGQLSWVDPTTAANAGITTDDIAEGINNQYFTPSRAKAAAVADALANGVTDVAPSQNAVYDALALKFDKSGGTLTGSLTTGAQNALSVAPYNSGAGQTGEVRFKELNAGEGNYVGFKAPDSVAADKIWTLPAADGSANMVLKTDGSGNLGWVSASSLIVEDALNDGTTNVAPSQNAVVDALAVKLDKSGGNMTGDIAMGNNRVTGLNAPSAASDAATKGYADAMLAQTVTNGVTTSAPSQDAVYDSLAAKLNTSGGTMSGDIAMGNNRVTGLNAPSAASDAATKSYADAMLAQTITNGVTTSAPSQDAVHDALDTGLAGKLNLSGGSLSGTLTTTTQSAVAVAPYNTAAGQTGEIQFKELSIIEGNYVGFKAPDSVTANQVWTLPAADGAANTVLKTDGAGNLSWGSAASLTVADAINDGTTTVAPSQNAVHDALAAKMNLAGGTMSGDIAMGKNRVTGLNAPSAATDAATKGYTDTAVAAKLNLSGGTLTGTLNTSSQSALHVAPYNTNAGQTGEVRFGELSGSEYVGFKAPDAIGANKVWVLPSTDGAADQVLKTDGAGNLGWVSPGAMSVSQTITNGVTATSPSQDAVHDALADKLGTGGGTMSGDIAMGNNRVTGLNAPSAASDAATKSYADGLVAQTITNGVQTTAPSQDAVHDALTGKLNTSGGTMSGNIAMGNNAVSGVSTMTATAVDAGTVTTSTQNAVNVAPYNTGAGQTSEVRFRELSLIENNYVGFKAPDSITANKVWVLPAADGTTDQVLKTDGSGNLGWASAGSLASGKLNLSGGTMSGDIAMGNNRVTGLNSPSASSDAATKGYADGLIAQTITGGQTTTAPSQDAVATGLAAKLNLGGGTMTGNIAMGNNRVTGLNAPSASTDAATKGYADGLIAQTITGGQTTTAPSQDAVATGLAAKLNLNGGTMSGNIAMGNNAVSGVSTLTATTVTGTTVNATNLATSGQNAVNLAPYNTGAGQTSEVRFRELNTTENNYVGFKAPDSITANKVWVLPSADGSSDQVLKTDGSGNLGWASAGSLASGKLNLIGGTMSGDIAMGNNRVTGLNAPSASSDAATKAYADGLIAQTITGGQTTTAPSQDAVSTGLAAKLNLSGGTISGNIAMGNNAVSGVSTLTATTVTGTTVNGTTVNAATLATSGQNAVNLAPYNTGAGQTSEVRFRELNTSENNYVGFKAPDSITANKVWVLPAADGSTDQILKTDGSGNLGWATASSLATGKLSLTGGTMSGDIAMGNNRVTGLNSPSASSDAATKGYADGLIAQTITGGQTTTAPSQDAVATGLAAKLNLSGGTMTGAIAMGNQNISGVNTVTATNANATTFTSSGQNALNVAPYNTGAGQTSEVRFRELSLVENNYVGFKAPDSITANKVWVLPAADGTSDQVLKTDGSGNLGWASASSLATGKLSLTGGTMSGDIAMGNNRVTGLNAPSAGSDAATKTYADGKLALTGGTMSGDIAMGNSRVTGLNAPSAGSDAATKTYADGLIANSITNGVTASAPNQDQVFDALAAKMSLNGSTTPTADLPMGTHKITGLGTPSASTDAATKGYADGLIANSITNGVTSSAPNQDQVYDNLALKLNLTGGTLSGTLNGTSVFTSGDSGIGTSSPAGRLEVQETLGSGTEDSMLVLDSDNGSTNSGVSLDLKNANSAAGFLAGIAGLDDGDKDGRIEFRTSNDAIATTSRLTSADTRMTIKQDGKVGIGTTSPDALLTLSGGHLKIHNEWLYTSGNTGWFNSTWGGGWYMTDASWMRVYQDKSIWTAGTIAAGYRVETPEIHMGWNPGGGSFDEAWMRYYAETGENTRLEIRVQNDGEDDVYIRGSGGTTTGTGDLAELYYSKEKLQIGDVVVFDETTPAAVKKSLGVDSQALVGVVSGKPFALLMALSIEKLDNPDYHPVALQGKMMVKFSLENGPIKAGDPLTASSIPGYAMKATGSGRIIGHAFESYDGSIQSTPGVEEMFADVSEGCSDCDPRWRVFPKTEVASAPGTYKQGIVLALIQPTYMSEAEAGSNAKDQKIEALQGEVESLKAQQNETQKRLEALEKLLKAQPH